jgi:hypothetical protein
VNANSCVAYTPHPPKPCRTVGVLDLQVQVVGQFEPQRRHPQLGWISDARRREQTTLLRRIQTGVLGHTSASLGRGGGGPAITNIDLLACSDVEVGENFLG